MSKPNDIPNDVWETSCDLYLDGGRIAIAHALMAERDRCAKAATEMNERLLGESMADSINGYVDDAIRNPEHKP